MGERKSICSRFVDVNIIGMHLSVMKLHVQLNNGYLNYYHDDNAEENVQPKGCFDLKLLSSVCAHVPISHLISPFSLFMLFTLKTGCITEQVSATDKNIILQFESGSEAHKVSTRSLF